MEALLLNFVFKILRWLFSWLFKLLWPLIRFLLIVMALIAAVIIIRQLLIRRLHPASRAHA